MLISFNLHPAFAQIRGLKITPSDASIGDKFGRSVAISDEYVIVGASSDDDNGIVSGSAYVYKWTGSSWLQEAKLLPTDGAELEHFGSSVSINGDYAVVGAVFDKNHEVSKGAAYVFKRTGTNWAQEAKLVPSDEETVDEYGASVSIFGDYVIVGSPFDPWADGAAYVFKRTGTNWAQEAKFDYPDTYVG